MTQHTRLLNGGQYPPAERHDYRELRANPYTKEYQAEHMQPVLRYLRSRFKNDLKMTYNDVSRRSGHSYPTLQRLLTQGTGSPSFFDIALIANAAGTSLDYLGELVGLFQPERVTDPYRRMAVSDEEERLIKRLRQVQDPGLRALVLQNVETALEYAEPATPATEQKVEEKRDARPSHPPATPLQRAE